MPDMIEKGLKARLGRFIRFALPEAGKLLLVFVLIELLLQAVAPQYAGRIFDREFTGGFPIAMNEDGYRGARVAVEKAPGEFRILALGDSLTFGTGVTAEDPWPRRLAAWRPAPGPGPVTSINAALPGAGLRELTHAYEARWTEYRPDLVVLGLGNNMVSLAWNRRNEAPRLPSNGFLGTTPGRIQEAKTFLKRLVHLPATPHFLKVNVERALFRIGLGDHRVDPDAPYGPMLAHGLRQSDLDVTLADRAWALLEEDLRALRDATRRRGTRLVVVYIPARFMLTDRGSDNEKRVPRERLTIDPGARAKAACASLGIPFLDAAPALREARERLAKERGSEPPMYIPFDFSHLDEDGHDAVARRLAERLKEEK